MTQRELPLKQYKDQSYELCAGHGRCPEEQPKWWHLGSSCHIKGRTGVTVPGSHESSPPPCSGSAKNLPPPEKAGGAHSGFAIIISSLPTKWRQVVFTEHTTHYYFKRGLWNQEAWWIYEISSYFSKMVIIQFISFAACLSWNII